MAEEFKDFYNVREDLFRAMVGHRLETPASRTNKNPGRLCQHFRIHAYRPRYLTVRSITHVPDSFGLRRGRSAL